MHPCGLLPNRRRSGSDTDLELRHFVCEGEGSGKRRKGWGRGYSMVATTSPLPTESPVATLISLTVPAFSAAMLFSIFMASRTQIVWPASTSWPTSTSTLTMVPCIGTVTAPEPPAAAAPPAPPDRRGRAAAGPPEPAATAVPADSGTQRLTA